MEDEERKLKIKTLRQEHVAHISNGTYTSSESKPVSNPIRVSIHVRTVMYTQFFLYREPV